MSCCCDDHSEVAWRRDSGIAGMGNSRPETPEVARCCRDHRTGRAWDALRGIPPEPPSDWEVVWTILKLKAVRAILRPTLRFHVWYEMRRQKAQAEVWEEGEKDE